MIRLAAGLLLALALGSAASAAVTTRLGRDTIALGDSVQLTLQRDSAGGGEPDLSPLEKDFDILGRSASTSLQIVNGRSNAQRQLILTLVPKHDGRIDIPALQWGGEQSSPLSLTVSADGGASADPANAAPPPTAHALLSHRVDTPSPYMQAAVSLTVRVDTDDAINQPSLELAGSNDLVVQRIGQDVQGEETRNGRRYHVTERRYLLFPQRSGELRIDGPVLDAQVAEDNVGNGGVDPLFGRIFGRMRLPGTLQPLRLRGDAVTLNVRPRPAGQQASDWLPAKAVTLDDGAPAKAADTHAGDPITLHLRLGAVGLAAAQLPDLSARLQLPPGLRAYPDQARLNDAEKDGSILGRRDQDVALIADQPGRYTLPALHLSWWDTVQDRPREAVLPARTIDVLPAINGTATPPPVAATPAPVAAPASASSPISRVDTAPEPWWRWVSLGLALLWIVTLIAWWLSRRKTGASAPARVAAPSVELSEQGARRAFEAACRGDDPQRARSAALAWAAIAWPTRPPSGLHALARKIAAPEVTRLLRELDQACIDKTSWHGAALADRLTSLPADPPQPAAAPRLPELYGSDGA